MVKMKVFMFKTDKMVYAYMVKMKWDMLKMDKDEKNI
jgi:hypothetical protein